MMGLTVLEKKYNAGMFLYSILLHWIGDSAFGATISNLTSKANIIKYEVRYPVCWSKNTVCFSFPALLEKKKISFGVSLKKTHQELWGDWIQACYYARSSKMMVEV